MKAIQEITERPLIIYAVDFITPNPIKAQFAGNLMSISLADKDGFDEVTRNLPKNSKIDILLHSPGGSAEATESIVAPAQAIKDQFETAQKEINADPQKLPSWVPILGWFGPA